MKKFKFTIRGNTYDVDLKKIEENIATIEVNGTLYEVELEPEKKTSKTPTLVRKVILSGAEKIEKKECGSTTPVRAPLPGNILSVKVKRGDIIKRGDVLVIMEAMKMENNVMAEKDGVVENVNVKPGETVLEGDSLLEIV
ncbi:MAG: biotin/lipoyl-binding protein [Bacteroidales bacterium]|nr:biotin/lipoyl-binding protein [Bacteroidales bacterium]MBN2763511.1 biotin/lipoyl-binding protein [Bacteroidales bacterium]